MEGSLSPAGVSVRSLLLRLVSRDEAAVSRQVEGSSDAPLLTRTALTAESPVHWYSVAGSNGEPFG